MPVDILVVPLTKQILINGEDQLKVNICDFELLKMIALHPKLTVGLSV